MSIFFENRILNLTKSFFSKYPFFCIYIFVFALVSYGILHSTGINYLFDLLLYFSVFTFSYFLFFHKIKFKFINIILNKYYLYNGKYEKFFNALAYLFLLFILLFILYFFFFLGHIPALTSYLSLDYYGIALIRQSIIEHDNTSIKYINSFMLKGFLPFFLIYFLLKNRFVFVLLLTVSIFYSIALMQKSYIVTVLTPLIIYAFLERKYILTLLLSIIPFAGIYLLVFITNPQLRASADEIELYLSDKDSVYINKMYKDMHSSGVKKNNSAIENITTATEGVTTRVFVTTGKASAYWFELIPDTFNYAYGCGYNFLAPVLGCNFKEYEYSRKIYDIVYEKYAKKGLEGTVTASSFVYDYANFGKLGLVLSGIILSLLFLTIQFIFKDSIKWLISINFLSIFWLSSAYYTTLLLSGGWALLILLFIIFKPQLNKKQEC